jgi:ATP-dependent RNA helicase RhlE
VFQFRMDPIQPTEKITFNNLGIAPGLLAVLEKLGFETPTPIQRQAIPHGIVGKDVVGVAQTGTGKTLAFSIPLLQRLAESGGGKQGLVLLPTRELALQVAEEIGALGKIAGVRVAVLIGGAPMNPQLRSLKAKPHVVVATPGRLIDHMDQGTFSLARVGVVILDEADRMLDMGFWPQIRKIVEGLPRERQTMLFSATLSREIMELATKHMKLPTRIEVAPPGTTADKVSQEFFIVQNQDKVRLLEKILGERMGSTIVFTRTKHGATKVMRAIKQMGHSAAEIHGNRSLGQRKDALEGFKSGRYRILVATDIAARGIDVKGVELVLNFDLPTQSEDYVHRIGRTARAGATGHAISFAMPDQKRDIRDIEKLIRKTIPVSQPSDLPPARMVPYSSRDDHARPVSHARGQGHASHSHSGNSSRPHSSAGPRRGGFRGGRNFGARRSGGR